MMTNRLQLGAQVWVHRQDDDRVRLSGTVVEYNQWTGDPIVETQEPGGKPFRLHIRPDDRSYAGYWFIVR